MLYADRVPTPPNRMKQKIFFTLLVAALTVVGWATVETFRLFAATQQVADSQVTEMRVAAKLASVRAKHANLANVDPSAREGGQNK